MPGTPIAKSASFFSANSFTCFGVIICSASELQVFRPERRASSSGDRSPLHPHGRRAPDLEMQVGGVQLNHLLQMAA